MGQLDTNYYNNINTNPNLELLKAQNFNNNSIKRNEIRKELRIATEKLRIICEGLRDAIKESNDILQNRTKHLRKYL